MTKIITEKDEQYAFFPMNIRYLRKQKRMSQTKLGQQFNLSHAAVSEWERGKSAPSGPVLDKLCEFFGLDIEHLFDINLKDKNISGKSNAKPYQVDNDIPFVPVVHIKAQAGYMKSSGDERYLEQLEMVQVFTLRGRSGSSNYLVFEIEGDSMYPTLYDGDLVCCRKVELENWLRPPKLRIYVIITKEGEFICKRYLGTRDNALVFESENKDYPQEISVGVEDIGELWKVESIVLRNNVI